MPLTRTVTFRHKVNGVLADADSVVLADPNGIYGVKQERADAVVVAAGTAMQRDSEGVYSYTFTEPPGSSSASTYTASILYVYEGVTRYLDRFITTSAALSLSSQKKFQRVCGQGDDDDIGWNLLAAADWIERETNHAITATSRTRSLTCWPGGRDVLLWPIPLIEVSAVTYLDDNGSVQAVDPADYRLDNVTKPGRFRFASTFASPTLGESANPINVTYRAGYDDPADAPPTLLAAVRILASTLFENREATAPVALSVVPVGVQRLLDLHRFPRLEGD